MNDATTSASTVQLWTLDTPLGPMQVGLDAQGHFTEITFAPHGSRANAPEAGELPTAVRTLLTQLDEFAKGERDAFDLPLATRGTEFERAVWTHALAIPRGSTTTYAAIARALGKPAAAARAVGGALGRNPWHVIVPCHRVVGRDGRLTGYAAGLDIKQRLLELEGTHAPASPA